MRPFLDNESMSQLICPDCKNQVSEGVSNCPECGLHKSYFRDSAGLNLECKWCQHENAAITKFCQKCGSPNWIFAREDEAKVSHGTGGVNEIIGKKLIDGSKSELLIVLIREQRKTTHATRALAITFVAAPIIAFVVAVAMLLATQSGNAAVMVIAGILGVIALIWVLVASLEELRASRLD